jgi:hypothetical protein
MRIISSFRDYYDCVQSQGQDQTLVYLRQPREEKLPELFSFTEILHRNCYFPDTFLSGCFIVGFCGRIYPILRVQHPSRRDIQPALCFTLDDVDAFVHTAFKAQVIERYFSTKRQSYRRETWRHPSHNQFGRFFQEAAECRDKYKHLFQEKHCPVFTCWVGCECVITYNARLADMEFYRLVEPYTAFQEIAMFLGGMASPEKPIPKIDDKTLAQAKGFNQWSFRKEQK